MNLWRRTAERRHRVAVWISSHVAAILAGILVVMVACAGVSGWALDTAWTAKSHEIAVARHEAAAAVAKAQQADDRAAEAKEQAQIKAAHELEKARVAFCYLVGKYASAQGPTNQRSVDISAAWASLGRTEFLHCGQP